MVVLPKPAEVNIKQPDNNMEAVYFSTKSVRSVMKQLKDKNSAGIDGLPAILFEQLSNGLAFPLSMLFNMFMSTSKLPASWKSAIIIPLFKKGAPNNHCNYRPISITCITGKLM